MVMNRSCNFHLKMKMKCFSHLHTKEMIKQVRLRYVLPKTKMIAKKFDFYCDFCGDFFLEILEYPPSTYKGYANSCKNCPANSGHLSLDVLLLIFPVNEI